MAEAVLSMDQIGRSLTSVEDVARIMSVIAGRPQRFDFYNVEVSDLFRRLRGVRGCVWPFRGIRRAGLDPE